MTLASRALDTLFDTLPGRVRVVDVSGSVVRSNANAAASDARAEHAAGLAPREGAAMTLRRLWELERPTLAGARAPLPFVETPAMRALAGIDVRGDVLCVDRGGTTVNERVTAIPIRDSDGAVLGALLVEDDAAIVAGDDAGKESGAEQERIMSASARVASAIMHDVNNVLNAVMGAAFLLDYKAESPDAVRDYAARIREAAESGAALAARVARFVRQEPLHEGAAARVDLSALVDGVLDASGTMDRAGGIVVARDIEAGVHVTAMPDELGVAVGNIVQNAVEAMPDGGKLVVGIRSNSHDATVTIRDTGSGMSDETLRRAMEPFFSAQGSTRPGLGLAEAYGVVRRHRGRIEIASAPGNGTTVTLRFPLATDAFESGSGSVPAPKQRADVLHDEAGANEPLHVLVVEDDDAGREFLRRILRSVGYVVDAVGNCTEARGRLAVASESPYHVMLTDVTLPDGSGWELASYARACVPSLRIGVITGWEEARKPESGDVEFVMRKPLRAAELLALIAGRRASTTIG